MRSAKKPRVLTTIDRMMGQLRKLRKKVIIITKQQREVLQLYFGDSMIKNIIPRKISKRQIIKRTFPGKTAEEIKPGSNTISPETAPSHIIIHASTNNLPTNSVRETVKHIEELANCVKQRFPSSQIGLSSIIKRNDIELSTNIMDVNKKIEEFATKGALNL